MQIPFDLPAAPFVRVAQRAQHESIQRIQRHRRSVDDVLPLLDLHFVRDLVDGYAALGGFLVVLWITDGLPEVRDGKDHVRSLEGGLEALEVVEIARDHLDAPVGPDFAGGFAGVAGDASDCPAGLVDEGVGDRGALSWREH